MTVEEVRIWFQIRGVTVREWAEAGDFSPHTVYALLSRRNRGLRGEAHRAAVALRLKPGERTDGAYAMYGGPFPKDPAQEKFEMS